MTADQALARLEGRTVDADVQAEEKRPGVVLQQVVQGASDGVAVFQSRRAVGCDAGRRAFGEDGHAVADRVGPADGHGLGQGGVDLFVDRALHGRHHGLRHAAQVEHLLPRYRHGVAPLPLLQLLGRHVIGLVVGGVALQPHGHAFEHRRQRRGLHGLQRIAHGRVDSPGVEAVDRAAADAIAVGPIRQLPAVILQAGWRGKRVVVVLDQKQDGHFLDRGDVERFVNFSGAAAAVADDAEAERAFARSPRGPDAADHEAWHLAQVADHRQAPSGSVAVMGVAFAAVRRTIGVGHVLAEQLVRRGAEEQVAGEIAMQKRHNVAAGPKRHGHARRRRLIAGARRHSALGIALLEQLHEPLFHPPGEQHQGIRQRVEVGLREPLGKLDHRGRTPDRVDPRQLVAAPQFAGPSPYGQPRRPTEARHLTTLRPAGCPTKKTTETPF